MKRHHVRFPALDTRQFDQDEAFFTLIDPQGCETQIRFHDYDEIYSRPGLYEQLFHDRLKCVSPHKVVEILHLALREDPARFNELRVLDLGAGNGLVGLELQQRGVSRIVGIDISAAARLAAARDRPGVYDDYFSFDMLRLSEEQSARLEAWRFNCMVCVAALGFGDIPVPVFAKAFNLVSDGGWVAFNIKETFLDNRDRSGFSVFVKNLILSDYLDVYHLERYRHRLSIDGEPLHYFAVACRKNCAIPLSMVNSD